MSPNQAQSYKRGLLFDTDIDIIAKKENANLTPKSDDNVRAIVSTFNQHKKALSIDCNRDTAVSMAFWLRPQNIDIHPGTLLGEQNVYYFRYLSNRQLQFNHYLKRDIETPGVLTEDTWQHIAYSLSKQGKLKIYFNGEIILEDSISSEWWKKKGQLQLGNDKYNMAAEGHIDELKIWNRVITPQEIKSVYKNSLLLPNLDLGLQLYLPLEENLNNLSNHQITLEKSENITFTNNPTERKSAYFLNKKSFLRLDGLSFDNQKTIALWIKPNENDSATALLGNSDFSLRYLTRTGRLWYSVPLKYGIKSKKSRVKPNQWIHVAVALNYNHKIEYYINGKKVDSQNIDESVGNSTHIDIGKSIWNNFYGGHMSGLAIWNRKLSDKEINEVYHGKLEPILSHQKANHIELYLFIFCVVMALVLLLLMIKYRKTSKKKNIIETSYNTLPQKNSIYFLQSFKAYDNHGHDFSNEFAPTLIRLLALVLIYPSVYKRAITSLEMSEIMWPGETLVQQKNNRSTNVHRLRSILKRIPELSLAYSNKAWSIEGLNKIFIDINSFELFIQSIGAGSTTHSLRFDKSIYTESFDEIIRLYNDGCLKIISQECINCNETKSWIRLAYISKLWLSIDTLSDEALKYHILALLKQGHKQNALKEFESFCKNYTLLLNEKYPITFDKVTMSM